jgi:hypothetical protein
VSYPLDLSAGKNAGRPVQNTRKPPRSETTIVPQALYNNAINPTILNIAKKKVAVNSWWEKPWKGNP